MITEQDETMMHVLLHSFSLVWNISGTLDPTSDVVEPPSSGPCFPQKIDVSQLNIQPTRRCKGLALGPF